MHKHALVTKLIIKVYYNIYYLLYNLGTTLLPHNHLQSSIPVSSNSSQDISTLLSRQNRKLKQVFGDGNCFFRALAVILYNDQNLHLKVRSDIVNFISGNKQLFEPLVIDPSGRETIDLHIQTMKKPMVWATQVELQAAVELYGVPLYLFTETPDKKSYQWLCYSKWTKSSKSVPHTHIELAHPGSVHFDCIVDATTNQTSTNPPQLSGNNAFPPVVQIA